MKKLRLAYFGTPDFAADFLARLVKDEDIALEVTHVVTQPDRPVGRKQVLTPTPVKQQAQELGLKVISSMQDADFLRECDLVLVYAYGEIIPEDLLLLPKYGFWNIHPSLLPLYRGPAPVAAALINGDTETGVTIIQLDREMDHGPILRQEKLEISPNERRLELTNRLTELGYRLFRSVILSLPKDPDEILHFIQNDSQEQDHAAATYTKLFTKEDGFVENSALKMQNAKLASEIFNKFRGLYPWPGIWTIIKLKVKSEKLEVEEKRLKITDLDLIDSKLVIKKVQLEGKNEVDFETFKKAYDISL